MAVFTVRVRELTLSDGSSAWNVALTGLDGWQTIFNASTERDAHEFGEKLIAAIQAHTIHDARPA